MTPLPVATGTKRPHSGPTSRSKMSARNRADAHLSRAGMIVWFSSAVILDSFFLGRVCKRLQPEQDHADVDHGEIVVATLLIAGGNAPGLLEAVDQPLDFVA